MVTILRVFLIRHGETDWNREGRLQGHTNIALNTTGQEQAEKISSLLYNYAMSEKMIFRSVTVSDLERSKQTGEILSKGLRAPLRIDSRWREISFGEWEGKRRKDLFVSYPELYGEWCKGVPDAAPPKGESRETAWERIQNALDALVERESWKNEHLPSGNFGQVVVMHGGVGNLILYRIPGTPYHIENKPPMGNCVIHELRWREPGEWSYYQYLELDRDQSRDSVEF